MLLLSDMTTVAADDVTAITTFRKLPNGLDSSRATVLNTVCVQYIAVLGSSRVAELRAKIMTLNCLSLDFKFL